MASGETILGQDENILLTCDNFISFHTPFTIYGTIYGMQKSDTFKLYLNDEVIYETQNINNDPNTNYNFSYDFLVTDLLLVNESFVFKWKGFKDGVLQSDSNEKTVTMLYPSVANSVYFAFSYLKNLLENHYGVSVGDNVGIESLLDMVERL